MNPKCSGELILFHGTSVNTVVPGIGKHEFIRSGLPRHTFHPDVVGYNPVVNDSGDVSGKSGCHERATDNSLV